MESWPETCSTSSAPERRLTVWRKSLLFNSHGYTVFDDADGRIVFRVDNYAHDWRRHTLLMDSHGNVLLTIRRCRPNVRYLCFIISFLYVFFFLIDISNPKKFDRDRVDFEYFEDRSTFEYCFTISGFNYN